MKRFFTSLPFFLLLATLCVAQQQTINVGTTPNDRTGDPLRTAFQKVNANFDELYSAMSQTVFNVETYGAVHDGSFASGMIVGTDDTEAIQDAIDACYAAGGGIVYFPHGIYVISGALQTSVNGVNPNGQLIIPRLQYNVTGNQVTIYLLGEAMATQRRATASADILPLNGVILWSTVTGSGTEPSVISNSFYNNGFADTNGVYWLMENITVRTKSKSDASTHIAPTMSGINAGRSGIFYGRFLTADTESVPLEGVAPTSANQIGIITPRINNAAASVNFLEMCTAVGYYYGFDGGEHVNWNALMANVCHAGFAFRGMNHTAQVGRIYSNACKYDVIFLGDARMIIDNLAVESFVDGAKWFNYTNTLYAPSPVNVLGSVTVLNVPAGGSSVGPVTVSGTITSLAIRNLGTTTAGLPTKSTADVLYNTYQRTFGGGTTPPTTGGMVASDGVNNPVILDINKGTTVSSDINWASIGMGHNNTSTTAKIAQWYAYNLASGDADVRLWLTNILNNGAIDAGIKKEYVNSGTALTQVLELTATYTKDLVPNIVDADISPAQLSGNTDNYAPTGIATAATLRISASGAINLTGIAGGATMVDGRRLTLINVGTTNTITLKTDVTSTAANRFLLNADFALAAQMAVELVYDGTSSRWRKTY